MSFEKGDKVQAVDELGRWEEARVLNVTEDGFHVSFTGWSARFNRSVADAEIRTVIDPFNIKGDGRGVKRGSKVASQQQLDQLRFLCRDDDVTFVDPDAQTDVSGKVHTVDKFTKTVLIDVGNNNPPQPRLQLFVQNSGQQLKIFLNKILLLNKLMH